MSEHRRRKPPQSNGSGRAARRGAPQPSSGRRAEAPPGADRSSGSYVAGAGRSEPYSVGSHQRVSGERPPGGRAEARRAAQTTGGRAARRRAAAGAGRSGGPRGSGRRRFIDYPRQGRSGWRHWVPSWKLVTGMCLTFVGSMVALFGIAYAMVKVPNENAAAKQQNNVYYWADGSRMVAAGSDVNRQNIPLSKMPQSMQNAVISAENASFYDDAGIDPKGIARALVDMALGGDTQSGSTITQQYVKNTYLNQDQTLTRKFKELFISIKVGATVDKPEILQGYLNTSWFGRGAYGLQAAAQAYYGIDAEDLNPSQSAFMAALLKGEGEFNPDWGKRQEQNARERWAWILDREVDVGRMSKAERAKYTADDFPMPKPQQKSATLAGQTGYLVELANNYIEANTDIDRKALARGGYQIHTTFNKKDTQYLEKSVKDVVKEDIDPSKREVDKYVQVGGASVVPGDGAIVAIYGGEDYLKHFTNNADYTGAQVGSTFKPFVLAAAMRDGVRNPQTGVPTRISPMSVYNGNNKVTVRDYTGAVWLDKDGNPWRQANDGGESRGPITLREAMQYSVNTPYIQLGMDVGLETVQKAAVDAGLPKSQLAGLTPTFSLGTSSPSAIRMANAYGTFASGGTEVEPYSVKRVEYNGEERYKHEVKTKEAFDPAVANNVTDVLTNVVQHGTGTVAKGINRPAAGKTGTTDENRSAWFVGYTPQLSTAIEMFRKNDNPPKNATKEEKGFLSMRGVGGQETIHGASYPTVIWTEYMKQALKTEPVKDFPAPEPIGQKIDGMGVPTTPPSTTAPEPSDTPTETPSPTETKHTKPPTETPTTTCAPWDPKCKETGKPSTDPTDTPTSTDGSTWW